jgi:phosphotriesterase-related protein
MSNIQTVTGVIDSAQLGLTLTHEHILNDVLSWWHPPLNDSPRARALVDEKVSMENLWELRHDPFVNKDNCTMTDRALAVKELQRFVAQGGKSIIETSADGNGRDPEGLAEISRTTGLNIIMGTGYYLDASQPAENDAKSERDIAQEIIRDITEGARGTKVRSGIIGEIGVGSSFTAREKKSLAAACVRYGDEVLDFCAARGVPMESIVLCHSNPSGDDYDYQSRLINRGAYIQYDMIGMEVFYADQQAQCPSGDDDARNIARLVANGHGARVLMSQDIFLKSLLRTYGGPGYGHLIEFFLPRLERHGLPLERSLALMTDNPRRLFEEAR